LGCPIAWISGFLNKVSFLKIKLKEDSCTSCGKCDNVCYITTHNESHSLHKGGLLNSSSHYSCSRCMDCVETCPTGALSLSPHMSIIVPKKEDKRSEQQKKNRKKRDHKTA
ncbi:MAG: 4Fe-4S dicluster domain-containing protein, partial [Deltaproteobacteria bacterium]|nr:4Fe-4S dicluster domain-containing protein [Deltaproteobacteria bacterium]